MREGFRHDDKKPNRESEEKQIGSRRSFLAGLGAAVLASAGAAIPHEASAAERLKTYHEKAEERLS